MRSPVLLLVIALGIFGAIGAVLLLRSIFQNKSDESTWNDLTDQHRPVRVSNPSAFTPGVYERLVVISAPYALCHHDPWDHLSCSDLDDTRNMLASGWDIHSRIDLLAQIFWLITLGDRDKFGVERAQWADVSLAEAERQELQELKEAGIAVQDITEKLWRLERMRNNDRGIQNVDFLAWDMLRAAMLTRCGAALNWLPEAEAWDTLALLDQALRMHYQNWGQVWESFRLGRWCWYSEDGEDTHYNDLHDLHRLQVVPYDPGRFHRRRCCCSPGRGRTGARSAVGALDRRSGHPPRTAPFPALRYRSRATPTLHKGHLRRPGTTTSLSVTTLSQ